MPAPVVHFEIGCKNLDVAKRFYGQLFGWEFPDPSPSMAMVGNIGSFVPQPTPGIGGHLSAMSPEPMNYVTIYAMVDDIEASLRHVEKLGGKTLIPKTEVPGMGHFAWFNDPEGNAVGLWTPMMK